MPCPRILSTSRFYKMTLRVRRVKVPPEELDLSLKPRLQPFHGVGAGFLAQVLNTLRPC